MRAFPDGFLWGSSTSAYQIEGAHDADGKGPSVWDWIAHTKGAVLNSDTGDVACDHYHRVDGDLALMRDLGLRAYRFSTAWSRVLPEGVGRVNEAGLDFYDRVVDGLMEAGIRPFLTLYHWDLPLTLHRRGGWLNRDVADWFGEYASLIAGRLGDRVRDWMTINEPQVFLNMGYSPQLRGNHEAGLTLDEKLLVIHNCLRAHGRGVQAIREHSKSEPRVGWAPVGVCNYPATDDPADIEAAKADTLGVNPAHYWNNTWYNDPIFFGHYPEDGLRAYAGKVPEIQPGDMELIAQPVDWLGINMYQGIAVKAGEKGPEHQLPFPPGHPRTRFAWPITPEILRWGPRWLYERYRVPLYITENGYSGTDWVHLDGRVHDPQRIDFLRRYLHQLRIAIDDGADIRGYFHWSLFDNFEWSEGYDQRFGLVHVDYQTLTRTPKDSFAYYREVIETNGGNL
ncbi:MAG: GH1 family beta-glucosidase [Phycisphaerales bacterium JB040]